MVCDSLPDVTEKKNCAPVTQLFDPDSDNATPRRLLRVY